MVHKNKWLKVLVTSSLVLGSYACTESKTTEEYQAEAASFIEKNDTKSAIITLKNALANSPENAELRFELGNAYLNQGDYQNAEKELDKAEKLGIDLELLLPRLVETKFKLLKFDEVFSLVEKGDGLTDANYVQILTYAGLSSLHQGKRDQAQQFIDRANQISSESVYGQIGKAYLAQTQEEADAGIAILDSLIAYSPDIVDVYLLKGYLLQGSKQYLLAAEAFVEYLTYRPKEYQILFFIAQNYLLGDELDKADVIVNKLLKISGNHPLVNQIKAQIEFDRKNYQLASEHGVKAYQQSDKFPTAIIIAGMSSYHLEHYEQAYKQLKNVKGKIPENHMVNEVIVELELRLGYENEAVRSINQLVDSGNANSALLIAASDQFFKAGDTASAQEFLQESIKLNNENPEEAINQGIMKLKLNDLGSGIDMLEEALDLEPTSEKAEAGLAFGYLMNEQYSKATAIAKRWQKGSEPVKGLLLEVSILQKQNLNTEAENLLKDVVKIEPTNLIALYKLGVYKHQAKDYDQAFEFYEEIIKLTSAHPGAMKGIIALAYKDELLAKRAITFYQDRIKSDDNSTLKLGLIYLHASLGDTKQALNLLSSMKLSKNPLKGLEIVKGDVYANAKNWAKAIESYKVATTSHPDNLKASNKLYAAYEKIGQLNNALHEVERISLLHKDNLALLLVKIHYQTRLQIAPKKSDLDRLSDNPIVAKNWVMHSSLGNIAFTAGDIPTAIEKYKLAYEMLPSGSNVSNLSRAMARLPAIDEAIKLLKSYLSDNKSDVAVQALLANAYLFKKDTKMAELVYLDLLSFSPKHMIALNNISYIYIETNQPTKALEYSEKAIKIAPLVPAVIDTYAQALMINKQNEQALKQFNKALGIKPGDIDIKLNKAEALLALGKDDEIPALISSMFKPNKEQKLKIKKLQLKIK